MSSGYVIPVDPAELANRFSYEDPRLDVDFDPEDEEFEDDEVLNVSSDAFASCLSEGDYESRVAPLLDKIPQREADVIQLYFIDKKRQADIAAIFGITQAAVSYRLYKGIKRLQFLLAIPQITEEELRTDLPEIFPKRFDCPRCQAPENHTCQICRGQGSILIDVEILVGMWELTSQTAVANKLQLTQGRVRHRFFDAVKVLEDVVHLDERFNPYWQFFGAISNGKKFNILREVKLPQWADRGVDECL